MKHLALGAALAAPMAGGSIYLLSVFMSPVCENTPIRTVPSPDGKHKAVLFDRGCGATTGFSSQISIIPAEEDIPDEVGNVFVADLPAGVANASRDRPSVDVLWRSLQVVELRYEPAARLFKHEETAAGIAITYRVKSGD